jgi:small-conductance mechanosensitive channel
MAVMRRIALIGWLCLLGWGGALAQDAPPPPEPSRLAADWWTYFVAEDKPDPDRMRARIAAARDYLISVQTRINEADRDRLLPLVETVIAALGRYEQIALSQPPSPTPPIPPSEKYGLDQVLDLVAQIRRVAQARSELQPEIEGLERAIKTGKQSLSQRKVAYLELAEGAPERFEQGLELMGSRLHLETAGQELRWQRAQKKHLDEQLANLEAVRKAALDRFSADAKDIEAWQARRAEAAQKLDELRPSLARAQLSSSGAPPTSAEERAKADLARLHIIRLETEVATQEASLVGADLAVALLQRVLSGHQSDTQDDREALDQARSRLNETSGRVRVWRETVGRIRAGAVARVGEAPDSPVASRYRVVLSAADGAEQQLQALEEQLSESAAIGDVLDGVLRQREGHIGRGVRLAEDAAEFTWESLKGLLTVSLFEINETPVTALGLLRVVMILVIAWWVSKLLRSAINRFSQRRVGVGKSSFYTLGRMAHYVILLIGFIVGLSSIGIDFTKFALFASALGVGIGFGLQTLISNFVAGLIILFEKSLNVGDYVELESGVTGEVREINIRSTLITTNDNVDMLIPNSEFVGGRVINWTLREAYRRTRVPFGVAYGSDKDLVKMAALEAAAEVSYTLTGHRGRAPRVWLVGFGDSSLNFELVVWLTQDAVKRPGAVNAAYLWAIESALAKYGIEIPFPQRDLHLRSVFGHKDDDGFSAWSQLRGGQT